MTFRKNTLMTVANNATSMALGLLTSILLSHWIGPKGRGELAAAMLWPQLLVYIASMGLISASLYFAAQRDVDQAKLVTNAVILGICQSILAMPIGYVLLPHLLHTQSAQTIANSRFFLIAIPTMLIYQFLLYILQGRLMILISNSIRLLNPVFYLICSVYLHFAHKITVTRLVDLNLGLLVLTLVATIIAYIVLNIQVNRSLDIPLAKKMLRYGAQVMVGDIAGTANLRLDQTLIAAWLPPAQLGLYVAAVSAVNVGQLLSNSVKATATPTIARELTHQGKIATLTRIFRKYWLISIGSNAALGLLIPIVLPIVFGKPFRGSVPSAEVLLIGTFFFGARDVLTGGTQALGRPWIGTVGSVTAVAVTVSSLFYLVPRIGIMGGAIASVLAYGTEAAVDTLCLCRTDGLKVSDLLYVRLDDLRAIVGEGKAFASKLLRRSANAGS